MVSSKVAYCCLKLLMVLLFWTIVLMIVQKFYSHHSSYIDHNNQIKRKLRYTDFFEKHNLIKKSLIKNITGFEELHTDKSVVLSNETYFAFMESELSSMPIRYWANAKRQPKKPKCGTFPTIFELSYYNTYWQAVSIQNFKFLLYNAYYDERGEVLVRVLTMVNGTEVKLPVYCQLWYENTREPDVTEAMDFQRIWPNDSVPKAALYPFLFSCPIGKNNTRLPQVVSIVANKCNKSGNALRIIHKKTFEGTKKKFAICTKALNDLEDFSAQLVEWIELQLLLGIHKIYFYLLSVHPNVTKVLEYYALRGYVDMRYTTLATGFPDMQYIQYFLVEAHHREYALNQQLFINDCFYRNLYRYDYISVKDISDILMPTQVELINWSDILSTVQTTADCPNGSASYCFGQKIAVENRSKLTEDTFNASSLSCLHHTASVTLLYEHIALEWSNRCPPATADMSVSIAKHYSKIPTLDNTIDEWRSLRHEKTQVALEELDLLRPLEDNDSS